jgi:hypothetical protein
VRAHTDFGRFWSAIGAAVLGVAWSSSAIAADELPHHRVELTTDRTLPGCSDAFEFKAILTNWVPVSTIDPTAARALAVRINACPEKTSPPPPSAGRFSARLGAVARP